MIVPIKFDPGASDKSLLFAENPRYSFITAIELIKPELVESGQRGIHPSAQLSPTAQLGVNVSIGPLSVIGDGSKHN